MKTLKSKKQGFTIIEVVLVLAIAGLIFLMVFIALPALQQSQRNAKYKNNLSIVISLFKNYKANNRGKNPPWTSNESNPTVSDIFVVGQPRLTSHPFYKYIEGSGLENGTNIKINNFPGNYQLNEGVGREQVGRIIIWLDMECGAPSGPWLGFKFYRSQGKTAAMTVLEEGDGLVYCQNV